MIIIGLDDKEYKINLGNYTYNKNKRRSQLCSGAIDVIKSIYPSDPICEEIYLPGATSKIYLDLFLPKRNLAIEVDGRQHNLYSNHFHKNKYGFAKSQRRDREKTDLLEINNITLVRLLHNESPTEWRRKLLYRFDGESSIESRSPSG